MDYECIHRTILDGNVMNMSLIILKGNDGSIDAKNTSYQG